MSGSFVKGCVVGLLCALVGGATVALAGSGIGGVFSLGVSNSVNAKTTLTGATPGVQLQVTNTNAAAGTSGLAVTSASVATTGVFTNSGGGPAGGFFVNCPGRCPDRPLLPQHLPPAARRGGALRDDPGALARGALPRAFPRLQVRARRRGHIPVRVGRSDAAQPRPADGGPCAYPGAGATGPDR
jgi:hypothetical protein